MAGAASSSGKVCVVCGIDCADKPRTKDAKGRYYCKPCYDGAAAKKKAPGASPPSSVSAPLFGEPDTASVLDELIKVEAPPVQMSFPCPKCGHQVHAGSLLCTSCGFSFQTGGAVAATSIKKVKHKSPGGAIWPGIIGVISILLGLTGIGLAIADVVARPISTTGTSTAYLAGRLGAIGLMLSMNLWLTIAGYKIMQKDSSSVWLMRRWSIVAFILNGTCSAFLLVALATLATAKASSDPRLSKVDITPLQSFGAWFTVGLAAWALVMFIWFFLPNVRRDTSTWN